MNECFFFLNFAVRWSLNFRFEKLDVIRRSTTNVVITKKKNISVELRNIRSKFTYIIPDLFIKNRTKLNIHEWMAFLFFFSVQSHMRTHINLYGYFIIKNVKFISVSAVNIHRTKLYWNNNRIIFELTCVFNLQFLIKHFKLETLFFFFFFFLLSFCNLSIEYQLR